ncbi:hypothetical protein G6F24_012005 [Rhizopus arrhizus]|nr:hypothetical protein G6F24_012005 [Rhizopus arrhizus]
MDEQATSDLLAHVPDSAFISPDAHESLTNYWTVDEVSKCLQRIPTKSSPGVDGIPYVILRLLFDHPFIRQLFLHVLNTALREDKYPPTWQRSVIILLPKKGVRSQLKSWIPISLICTDAKIFTRLLTTRLTPSLSDLIDPHQTGFMAGRNYKRPGFSLLLDQEKAYDRVHPDYLHACLTRFGLPSRLINCITSLFFNTSICVNVNGFVSVHFAQGRRLRQRDPLLRTIYVSPSITGFSFQVGSATRLTNPLAQVPILKSMAYADDLAVFPVDSGELHVLLDILALYSRASNARLNRHKTLAISLSGQSHQPWQSALSSHGITHFLDNLLLKLQQRAQMLTQRNLSILGRSLVTNTLLLGLLWHAIRVLAVPQSYLGKIRSTIIQFLAPKNFPAVSFQACQRSCKEGGLAILNPGIQHAALQLRWLQPLLLPSSDPTYYDTFVSDILRHCLRLFSVSPSHILSLLLPNMRSNTIKSFGCFSSFFRTMDKLDYKIDWQAFDIRMVNELPLTQVCPYLLLPNKDFKASYWSGIFVKHVYEFSMTCDSFNYVVYKKSPSFRDSNVHTIRST